MVNRATVSHTSTDGKRLTGAEPFRPVAEDAPAILWTTDSSGSCTYLNREWFCLTGQCEAEALGYGWTAAVHPDDREPAKLTFLGALERREPFQLDYRLRRHDGVYRHAIDAGRPHFDADGIFLGYVGCVLDITERKELEHALMQAQKMEAVGRLAGGIAHDFNNVLAAIASHAHLVMEELEGNDEVREDLRGIQAAVERASALTKRLLALSRKQVVRPEPLDLNVAVGAAQAMFTRIIGADIELRVRTHDHLPRIIADRSQLDQVILNLVVNAREAMPKGGVLEITTDAWDDDGARTMDASSVVLAVRDTGVGMDDATRQHLFEPFFSTKAEGTGLGLATVYSIVKHAGGAIRVASRPGEGSTFTVIFPAGPAPRQTEER